MPSIRQTPIDWVGLSVQPLQSSQGARVWNPWETFPGRGIDEANV